MNQNGPAVKKEECDDEDEVVREMPVFLSRALQEKLWVLQYPVRPAHMTYDRAHFTEARVRAKQRQLQLEVEINTSNSSYDISKGEQIALNVDGSRLTRDVNDIYYKSSVMDKQVLSSTPVCRQAQRYCVGVVQDGELHLSPVDAVVALRPSFSYLDRSDKKGKQEAREKGEDVSGDEEDPDEVSTEKVTVKFSRPESDRAKQMREKSYRYVKKKQEEEQWIPATFHRRSSASSEAEWQKLLCWRPEERSLSATSQLAEYRGRLLAEQTAPADGQLPLRSVAVLPLSEQLRTLLTRLKLAHFSYIHQRLPRGTAPAEAVRLLQQVAHLINGVWLVRSDVLYPKGHRSPVTGVCGELLARGRDLMLYQFTQSQYLSRAQLISDTRLPPEDVAQLLDQLAELVPSRGWKLKLKADPHHEKAYPEVVQRQQMLWEAKHQQLLKAFQQTGRPETLGSPGKARRRRQRSQRDSLSASSDNESGCEGQARVKQRRNSGVPVKTEPPERN